MPSTPALLRAHSASSLLHSLLQSLGNSAKAGTPAAWSHLAALLEHPALPSTETLPLSLVPSLTAALESRSLDGPGAGRVVASLATKFGARYHPALDHTATLVVASWEARGPRVPNTEAGEQLGLEGALSLMQVPRARGGAVGYMWYCTWNACARQRLDAGCLHLKIPLAAWA